MSNPPERDATRRRSSSAGPSGPPSRSGEALRALIGLTDRAPLELRLLGRTLLHAGAVGVFAGVVGAAFFAALELGQRLLLERLAGLSLLRAHGEALVTPEPGTLHPILLAALPALGGLASGVLTAWLAPEAAGGGGDATIEAYHRGGVIRGRVIPVKALASVLALSSGGSGGREGPTMHIGAGIGAAIGRVLPMRRSERRILVVSGIAAGIAAVFRTPLGAALLATEMLYRDDFEADALVPSIFASVVSYSIVIAVFGETTLFGTLPRFPFAPMHLPLYGLLAILIAAVAIAFTRALRGVARVLSPVPLWVRPALGGLMMGSLGTALVLWMRARGAPAVGFGVFGGGYGVVKVAMTGAPWLGTGWAAVGLLSGVALAKLAASALTIGSGASAGDFAPSLVIGGLVGASFGIAARTVLGDPSIDPAAFTLVGMGAFYGGIAHAPLSALVLVAELAGSYDLLVPMMLAIGIGYVALRRQTLYPAQVASRLASPAHRSRLPVSEVIDAVVRRPARELLIAPSVAPVQDDASIEQVVASASVAGRQRVVAVRGARGHTGLIELSTVFDVARDDTRWLRAHDAAVPFVHVDENAGWAEIADLLERCGLSQVPVTRRGDIVGWIGDQELRSAVMDAIRAPGGRG